MSVFILIPLLPLLASFTLALLGRRLSEASHKVAIPAVVLSFGLSVGAFVEILRNGPQSILLYRLLQSGSLVVDLSLYIDQLTVLLLLLVTGVSAVVHVYSSRYMIGDPRYSRFFAVICALYLCDGDARHEQQPAPDVHVLGGNGNLFLSLDLPLGREKGRVPGGHEGLPGECGGGCGTWVGRDLDLFHVWNAGHSADSGSSGEHQRTEYQSAELGGLDLPVQTTTLIVLLLFMGALGKSAQVPLHVWLPFAMEAPTPVSALIHAATMVNAGPFLLVRFSPLLVLSPVAMTVIAVIGATTALFAALVSLTQTDIKKLLAYSTISQIGFMIMTCGVGAFVAAIFHLLAHGFLKGFLFLSTGNALQSSQLMEALRPVPSHSSQARQAGPRPFAR